MRLYPKVSLTAVAVASLGSSIWACVSDDVVTGTPGTKSDAGAPQADAAVTTDAGKDPPLPIPDAGVLFAANFDANCGIVDGINGGTVVHAPTGGEGGSGACKVCATNAGDFFKGAAIRMPALPITTGGSYTFSYAGRSETGSNVTVQARADVGSATAVSGAELAFDKFVAHATTVLAPQVDDAGTRGLLFNLLIKTPDAGGSTCVTVDKFWFARD
jgi:hypothetical protein